MQSPEHYFLLFLLVGFLAQIVDGALGMAYGVVSSSALLAFGVTPAAASAATHTAEIFTTAASAGSHIWHRNVDWRAFRRLAPAGIIGGLVGTYILTSFDGSILRPAIAAYLGAMGIYILYRGWRKFGPARQHSGAELTGLGVTGGFMDAVGGGGWGPVVTTALIGTGGAPRTVIGTVNTAEFLLTLAVSTGFLVAMVTGHWTEAGLTGHLVAIGGLVLGGLAAAPMAGYAVRLLPPREMTFAVGLLIVALAIYQAVRLF